jgi:hypothetical protein
MTPPLVKYKTEAEYEIHYLREYCKNPVLTFDNIPVYFGKHKFKHSFCESSKRDGCKDQFSSIRAERIDWIKATLQDPQAILYQGWDKKRKSYDNSRRVAVVYGDYVVVIEIKDVGKSRKAEFVTAYVADNSISKIISSPRWISK